MGERVGLGGNINTPTTRIRFGGDRAEPAPGLSRLERNGLVIRVCGQTNVCRKRPPKADGGVALPDIAEERNFFG